MPKRNYIRALGYYMVWGSCSCRSGLKKRSGHFLEWNRKLTLVTCQGGIKGLQAADEIRVVIGAMVKTPYTAQQPSDKDVLTMAHREAASVKAFFWVCQRLVHNAMPETMKHRRNGLRVEQILDSIRKWQFSWPEGDNI